MARRRRLLLLLKLVTVQRGHTLPHSLLLHDSLEILPMRLDGLLQLTLLHQLLVKLCLHLDLFHQSLPHVVVAGGDADAREQHTGGGGGGTNHPAEAVRCRTSSHSVAAACGGAHRALSLIHI